MKDFKDQVKAWLDGRPEGERTLTAGAKVLGCSPSTLHYWLEGRLPPLTRLGNIATALQVPESALRDQVSAERRARNGAAALAGAVTVGGQHE